MSENLMFEIKKFYTLTTTICIFSFLSVLHVQIHSIIVSTSLLLVFELELISPFCPSESGPFGPISLQFPVKKE